MIPTEQKPKTDVKCLLTNNTLQGPKTVLIVEMILFNNCQNKCKPYDYLSYKKWH